MTRGVAAPKKSHGLSLYFHEASRGRLSALAQLLNVTKSAVVALAVSRWVLQISRSGEAQWAWHLEQPFHENGKCKRKKPPGAPKTYVRLPENIVRQIESLAETLRIPLSAVVEQALLRWCREDPLVSAQRQQQVTSAIQGEA